VLDSERSSAEKYARAEGTEESPGNWDFGHANLDEKNLNEYTVKIGEAAQEGIETLIIDSYSHSWMAALEVVDRMGGWVKAGKDISPRIARLVDSILSYPGHVICTFRSKSDNVIEKDERTGKNVIRKLGMAPVARPDSEFEFDLWLDLDREGTLTVGKSRFHGVIDVGTVYTREEIPKLVAALKQRLGSGTAPSPLESLLERVRFAQNAARLVRGCGEDFRRGAETARCRVCGEETRAPGGHVNDELRNAIATFVAASARFALGGPANRERLRMELHTTWHALGAVWEKHAP
jgi:hypothetical protein